MRAKIKCVKVTPYKHATTGAVISEAVHFDAVYSADPTTENYSFAQTTPALNLTMTIDNPDAFGCYKEGKEYFLDFSAVPAPTPPTPAAKAS